MPKNKNLNGGYIGILVILITVTLIIFFIVRTDLFTGQKGGKNMIEQGTSAVDSAKAVKETIEFNNRTTMEGL